MLFFNEKWQPSNTHTSPGHDIEAAWLLREAQAVLGENEEVNKLSRRLAVAARDGIMKEKQWWCRSGSRIYRPMAGYSGSALSQLS